MLKPYCELADGELERRCIGLIGAGDALTAAMVRGHCSEADAAKTFASLVQGGLLAAPP